MDDRLGAAEIAGLIRRDIVKGVLEPLDRLPPERALADTYAVARGTVREALSRLAEEGMVEIKRGSGTYVCPRGPEATNPVVEQARPLELIDTRFALEPHICRLAVLHARDADLDKAEGYLAIMEANTHSPADFAAADTRFHTVLAESTGNNLLIWIISQINTVRAHEQWSRMLMMTNDEATIQNYNLQHRAIVQAIRNRDPEAAAAHMKTHLGSAREALMRAAAA